MCTVFAYNGSALTKDDVVSILSKTKMRGPDDERIIPLERGYIAFQRLAIMGLTPEGMQPFFLNNNISVCNGEIYGFRTVKALLERKGYTFRSDSDCEILLPLYEEYGTQMFSRLDAEFALVIYDHRMKSLIAARDPIGIRPLFYGYDDSGAIFFASEAKMLQGVCKKVIPFPPGCYYKDGEFIEYRNISEVAGPYVRKPVGEITKQIQTLLIRAVEKRLDADAPLGFLLSGGLDSSLVCAISSRLLSKPIRTFAVGMRKDAIDLKYAKQTAEFLGADHSEIYMTRDDVIESLDEVISNLATWDITTIRASMGMYLLCKGIHETTDIRVLLTGEVSDELFGYKYTDFAPNADEFQKDSQKRIRELHVYDVLRADRCIADNSIEARVPFGDLDFVSFVMSIDPEMKMNRYGKGKYLLRKAFDGGSWLPDEILWREKAAFSDAVGHSMVDDLKEYAKEVYRGQDLENLYKKYPEKGRPYTPESLLYREIFEKHYPGGYGMIPDFWMPNKEWEGCDVDDPSARVLSNYGDSGK